MSDPYKNETWLELIARKPGNLNILVTARQFEHGTIHEGVIGMQPRYWNTVSVRYKYSTIDVANRTTSIGVDAPDGVPDGTAIAQAIADLQAEWGELPVFDNSGTQKIERPEISYP